MTRITALFQRRKREADMSEEMQLHLEQRIQENITSGMSPEEARHAALRKFGGVEQAKELARAQRPGVWLEHVTQDVRYAARQLARAKGFTAVVILTLAIGIGGTTAIYSVLDALVLDPVPGEEPERLVQIGERVVIRGKENFGGVSPPVLEALEGASEIFSEIVWHDSAQLERPTEDFTTIAFGTRVPAAFFQLFEARPLLGRAFVGEEEEVSYAKRVPERDSVVVLGHAWWKSEFGGARDVLGTAIEMGGKRFTVIGVMPEHFRFPGGSFWVPAKPLRPEPRTVQSPNTGVIARLKPGVTIVQAQAALDTIAQRLMQDYSVDGFGYGRWWARQSSGLRLWTKPLRAAFQDGRGAEELRRTLWAYFVAMGFVLVIVCANVANLALARTERRQSELAIRAALGASRGRIVRQLITESLLLAVLGGLAGLVVTHWGIRVLVSLNTLPQLRTVAVDPGVLGTGLLVSALTGLIFGLAPAWRGAQARIEEAIKRGAAGAALDRRGARFRGVLIVLQVSIALVLLTGAGLMVRSVVRALQVDVGYDPANLLTVHLHLGGQHRRAPRGADGWETLRLARNALLEDVRGRLAALPGVQAVGILREHYPAETISREDGAEQIEVLRTYSGVGDGDYFRAARVAVLAGRTFAASDAGESSPAVVVNETMARLFWPGGSAVGKTFRARLGNAEPRTYEVTGVTADVRLERFNEEVRPRFYRPYHESAQTGMNPRLVVRTASDPALLVPAIRRALKAAGPELMEPKIQVTRQVLRDSTRAHRTYRNYLLVFAGVALLLAAIGLYGVLAYAVARRTREIGVRIALGAGRRDVLSLVVGEGMRLVALGLVIGTMASLWLTRLIERQLYEVSVHDPLALAGAAAVLGGAALLACWLPARRAANIDPVVALRAE